MRHKFAIRYLKLLSPLFLMMAHSASAFDIQGLKTGMTEAEILAIADEIRTDDYQRIEHYFRTPQGKDLPETTHTKAISFSTADGSYRIDMTRPPMEPKAHTIQRNIQLPRDDISALPSFADFTSTLNQKYGEPIHRSGSMALFSDGKPGEGCPERLGFKNINPKQAKGCPTALEITIGTANHPNNPVTHVKFDMRDHYLHAKDRLEFQPYWNRWMHEYLESQDSSKEMPAL